MQKKKRFKDTQCVAWAVLYELEFKKGWLAEFTLMSANATSLPCVC